MTTTSATTLLAILRDGWDDGQRARALLPSLRPSLSALLTEAMRRYGSDREAGLVYVDGHCAGVENDAAARSAARNRIAAGKVTP